MKYGDCYDCCYAQVSLPVQNDYSHITCTKVDEGCVYEQDEKDLFTCIEELVEAGF